jgi:hypothetical protein
MHEKYDVFISYSRRNQRFVNRLAKDLKAHRIKVFIDTLEIKIGDQFRKKIEEGIENSRYFCIVISQPALESYYVRQMELEAAFSHMVRTSRESYILPIMWRKPDTPLPLMLSTYHYLDFSKRKNYYRQLSRLVKKIQLDDEEFTGKKWFKNIDVSPFGHLVGTTPLNHISYSGSCVKIFFKKGLAYRVELFEDGNLGGFKKIEYDEENRVYLNTLYRKNKIISTWKYFYDKKTGTRNLKQDFYPGKEPYFEITYNPKGDRLEERFIKSNGELDGSKEYAVKQYNYSSDGELLEIIYLDEFRNLLENNPEYEN